jgi:hypothetical protein
MIQTLKKLFYPLIALLSLGFILFLFNQVSSIYLAADRIHPTLGWTVLSLLVLVIGVLIMLPVSQYLRLPKPLSFPKSERAIPGFQLKLLKRFQNNEVLKKGNKIPKSIEELPAAITLLDKEADLVINETARVIFLTTAVSQNGKLDTFTVLGAQMRMVWKVSQIYYQRPTLREMSRIYGFVGASSFLAGEIEDLDITRQIEPVASALFKNASGKSVPLIGPAATLIMDSLLEGSTNAYLSLRVGILTKKYCGNQGVFDEKAIKSQSVREAARHLRTVSAQASASVISGLIVATKNAGLDTIKSSWEGLKKTGQKVGKGVSDVNPFKKKKAEKEPEQLN